MAISKRYLTTGLHDLRYTTADRKAKIQTDALYLHAIGIKVLGEELYYTNTMSDILVNWMKLLRSHGCLTDKLTKKAADHPKMARYVMEDLLDLVGGGARLQIRD